MLLAWKLLAIVEVTTTGDHEPIGTYDPHSPGNFSPRRSSAASTFQLSALANAPIAIQIPHLATIHGRLLHHAGNRGALGGKPADPRLRHRYYGLVTPCGAGATQQPTDTDISGRSSASTYETTACPFASPTSFQRPRRLLLVADCVAYYSRTGRDYLLVSDADVQRSSFDLIGPTLAIANRAAELESRTALYLNVCLPHNDWFAKSVMQSAGVGPRARASCSATVLRYRSAPRPAPGESPSRTN